MNVLGGYAHMTAFGVVLFFVSAVPSVVSKINDVCMNQSVSY